MGRRLWRLGSVLGAIALGCAAPPAEPPPRAPPPAPLPAPTPERQLPLPAPPTDQQRLLDFVTKLLDDEYAPAALKRRDLNWDSKKEIDRLRAALDKQPPASKRDKQRLLFEVMRSPRDIHAGVNFEGSRAVWLGVHALKTSDGKYRIAWVDPVRAAGAKLNVGDVVEAIDEMPIDKAIDAAGRDTLYRSTPSFDQAFAEWFLVMRSDEVWPSIPAVGAPATLRVRSAKDKKQRNVALSWLDYDKAPPSERCPFWGKTRNGYLPELGAIMWRTANDSPFVSYVFAIHGATWGYVRFHTYALESGERLRALDRWKEALNEFKKHEVRGVVVDQLGNGGGNFLFAYALFSRLTDKALRVPVQHYMATKERRLAGFGDAAFLAGARAKLKATTEAQAEAVLAKNEIFAPVDFMPRSLATLSSLDRFLAMLEQQARTAPPGITEPFPSLATEITPNPDGMLFTGKLVVLIDGLNISAAEYAAAALGDSGRALLMGTTTSGAGGDQREYRPDRTCTPAQENPLRPCLAPELANVLKSLGVTSITSTVTLGRRVDGSGNPTTYIENRGVQPAREHKISDKDLTGKFRDFRAAILDALR